jgi:hypothetical protein
MPQPYGPHPPSVNTNVDKLAVIDAGWRSLLDRVAETADLCRAAQRRHWCTSGSRVDLLV